MLDDDYTFPDIADKDILLQYSIRIIKKKPSLEEWGRLNIISQIAPNS